MSQKFSAVVHHRDDVSFIKLAGVIDEDNELSELTDKIVAPTLAVDLAEVERINSAGVRDWVNWLHRVEERISRIVFIECSPAIVAQLNQVHNFTASGYVKSFYVPYFCAECDEEKQLLCEAAEMGAAPHEPPTCRCDECDLVMEFDDLADTYFAFLSREKQRLATAELQSVLDEIASDGEKSRVRSRVGTASMSASHHRVASSLPSIPSLPSMSIGAGGELPSRQQPTRVSKPARGSGSNPKLAAAPPSTTGSNPSAPGSNPPRFETPNPSRIGAKIAKFEPSLDNLPTTPMLPVTPSPGDPLPRRERTPSPIRERTPSPIRERTPPPARELTPAPPRERTPTPIRELTPSPARGRTPLPIRELTPSPARGRTPSPIRELTPAPPRNRTLTPAPFSRSRVASEPPRSGVALYLLLFIVIAAIGGVAYVLAAGS